MEYQTQVKRFGNHFSRLDYIQSRHTFLVYNQHFIFNSRKIIYNNNNLQNKKGARRSSTRY